ncbi:MAG: baseplate J/gp47 family protein [Bacillota bacterium]
MGNYTEVYIDPEESLKSFLTKLQEVEEQRVVIIIHQHASIFSGQVNIGLMKKYAQRANKELIFITNIKKVQNLLAREEFEIYDNLEEFQRDNQQLVEQGQEGETIIGKEAPKIKSESSKLKKVIFFLLIFAIATGGWLYYKLPAITIKVEPALENKQIDSQLIADLNQSEIDFDNLKLPLITKEVKLETTTEVEASGEKTVGVEYARGVVTLINNQKEKVIIPKGTIIATRNGIKYKILSKTVVPKMEVEKMMDVVVGANAGKAEANIRALNKGQAGNVSSGRIVKFVEESYPLKMVNPEATAGGESESLSQINQEDIKRGLEKTKTKLQELAEEELLKKFGTEVFLFNDRIELEEPQLDPQAEAGSMQEKLSVVGTIKASGVAIKNEDLKDLAFKSYKEQLGTSFKLYNDKIKVKQVEIAEVIDEDLKLNVISRGEVIGNLDQSELIDGILGKKVANVKNLLDNMNEVSNYSIKPNNQINLPKFKYGVKLIVVEPTKE